MSEYITTYTGKHFKPIEPDPELFDIADIAQQMQCSPTDQNVFT